MLWRVARSPTWKSALGLGLHSAASALSSSATCLQFDKQTLLSILICLAFMVESVPSFSPLLQCFVLLFWVVLSGSAVGHKGNDG